MGYTRHFLFEEKSLDSTEFKLFAEDVKKIYAKSQEIGIALCESEGVDSPPVADAEYIQFNSADNPCEDFYLDSMEGLTEWRKQQNVTSVYGFCKTEHKPYDLIVAAVLIKFHEYFPETEIFSDGEDENKFTDKYWSDAKRFLDTISF